jgi:hypothetical protein
MILYHTTSRPDLMESSSGSSPAIVFATEPLSGLGPWVYSIDLPLTKVANYMLGNSAYRREGCSFYALPSQLVAESSPAREAYSDITGAAWNSFVVDVLDRRPKKGETDLLGTWALVWMSRDGVARARVAERADNLLSLTVDTTSEFNPERDYIVLEQHEEFSAPGGQHKETWRLFTVAGRTPQWQAFPTEWQDWVSNTDVASSAMKYLIEIAPSLTREIEYAHFLESKHNRARAWRDVADRLASLLSREQGRTVDLGKFAGHSWTAVMAIPLRIAMRVSQQTGSEWVPPIPKPEFQHPDESGRVLLANNYGAFPTRGPGVDHSTQDRPYEKRGGELKGPPKPHFTED